MSITNILTYAKKEFRSFKELPFNPIDSLIFVQLSYISFDCYLEHIDSKEIRLKDAYKAEYFEHDMFHTNRPVLDQELLTYLCANPRFRDVKLKHYTNDLNLEKEQQFSAITFVLPNHVIYVAYRGTDGNIVGWKEDFNMFFSFPVPSQEEARKYLEYVAAKFPTYKLIVGGHSKGANLAVYAVATVGEAIQERVLQVFDHDGPGFLSENMGKLHIEVIRDKIHKTVPQSSIFGLMMETNEGYRVVKSDGFFIFQHDPYTWQIERKDFTYLEGVTRSAVHVDETLTHWLKDLSVEERERFVEEFFSIIEQSGIRTLSDFADDWMKMIPRIVSVMKNTDPKTRGFIIEIMKNMNSHFVETLKLPKIPPVPKRLRLNKK